MNKYSNKQIQCEQKSVTPFYHRMVVVVSLLASVCVCVCVVFFVIHLVKMIFL